MKKLFACFFASVLVAHTFGQSRDSSFTIQEDYMAKSKRQKSAAKGLLIGGCVIFVIGGVISSANAVDAVLSDDDEAFNTGAVIALVGAAAMVGSIPLFIAGGKNKRKARAATVSLKMENTTVVRDYSTHLKKYPAMSIQFRL